MSVIGSANAATISWTSTLVPFGGTSGEVLTPGIFDTTGTLILAENSGGAALTFDGIAFTAPTIDFGSSGSSFHSSTELLSSTATYGSAGSSSTVSLTGLTVGNRYRVQALLIDARLRSFLRKVSFDGVDQGSFAHANVSNHGRLATGTFVADAATQSFTIETFEFLGGASHGGHLNAITLHQASAAVPEPSSVALLGLGGLALILRRRK